LLLPEQAEAVVLVTPPSFEWAIGPFGKRAGVVR